MVNGDQEVKVIGSTVLYIYLSGKTDRVIWQVTGTTGVLISGRVQAKLMNCISYLEIHTPQEQEQSPVSQDSLVYRLCTQSKDYKPQSTVYKDSTVY